MEYFLMFFIGLLFLCVQNTVHVSSASVEQLHKENEFTIHERPDFKKLAKFSSSRIKVYDSNNNALSSTLVEREDVGFSTEDHSSVNTKRPLPHQRAEAFAYQKQEKKKRHMESFTMTIAVKNETFTLDLRINRFLIAAEYTEAIVGSSGQKRNNIDLFSTHCYYLGTVRGYENSSAAVSTCNGIKGGFFIGEESYDISPDPDSKICLNCNHKIYKSSEQPQELKNFGCGHSDVNIDTREFSRKKRATISDEPQDLDGVTRIVEVYVINDYYQYQSQGNDSAAVFTRAKDILNTASLRYHSQNIYLVLIGQQAWTTPAAQVITVNTSSSSNLLRDFCNYVNANNSGNIPKRDAALYITSQGTFDGNNVVGLGYVGTMCQAWACAFTADVNPSTVLDAAEVTAHEIGHNFGLYHDGVAPCPACDDPSGLCIMNPAGSCLVGKIKCVKSVKIQSIDQRQMWLLQSGVGRRDGLNQKWSTCSKNKLASNLTYESQPCLNNIPQTLYDPNPLCGNGLVETGEQCDCGQAPTSECNPTCCNNVTCQLVAPAQCAFGRCCNVTTCKFRPLYTECRPAAGQCDLSEYCNGTDHACPSNVYMYNFSPCTIAGKAGNCYNGQCNNRDKQCQVVYGTSARASNDVCYTYWNAQGTYGFAGNCGYAVPGNYTGYVRCAPANVFCGQAQCVGGTMQLSGGTSSSGNYSSNDICFQPHFPMAIADGNPGYIQDGSPCGTGLACLGQVCKNITILTAGKCPNCYGNGVCNSLYQCHCNVGYAPPSCNTAGDGGSLHSNPIAPRGTESTTKSTTKILTTTKKRKNSG